MKHWLIDVTNEMGFKERLPRIKALRPILVKLGIGFLKDAKEFISREKNLKVYSMYEASRIIAFCDEHGLAIEVTVVTARKLTHAEYKRLEEG